MTTLELITFAALGVLGVAVVFLGYLLATLWQRQKTLFRGKRAKDLEELFRAQADDVKKLDHEVAELYEVTNRLLAVTRKGVQKVGVVRFNPFPDIGGDQSFVICLMDAENCGIVLSSLHTREGTRVYAKPIENGKSPYPFSPEEEKALRQAMTETSRQARGIKDDDGKNPRRSKNSAQG